MDGGKKVAWRERSSLHDYLAPLFFTARLIGGFPMDATFKLRLLPMIHTTFMMAVMTIAGFLYSYLSYGVAWNANALTYMGTVLISILTALIVTINNIRNAKKMMVAIDKIALIDDYFWDLGLVFKYHTREVHSQIFVRAFFKVVMVVFDWIAYKENITQLSGPLVIVSLYYSYFVMYNIQLQFTTLMSVLAKHLRMLNVEAKKQRSKADVLEHLLVAHYLLSEACNLLISWFSPQLLLICALVFLVTTLNVSSAFMSLISFLDPYPPQITLFLSCVFWIGARLFELWEIVYLSLDIESESKELGQSLSRLIIDKEMTTHNAMVRIHLDCCPNLSITASHFFNIDYTLFISMLSSMTTYVVIMVQAQPQMKGVVCLIPSSSNSSNRIQN